ncbi:MAG TPA: primosomal protein N' [Anaerolineales bacterium]|nr:primosomal protein N' [Anaerolineales bacterium]
MYVEVAVNLSPVRGTFHYHVPADLQDRIRLGHLVTAPFGSRRVQGVVVGFPSVPEVPETRPIVDLVDPEPVFTAVQLELARWLQAHTTAALIDCLTLMLPPGLSQEADSLYRLEIHDFQSDSRTAQRLLALLQQRGPLRGRQIQRALPRLRWKPQAEALVRKGILAREAILSPPSVRPRHIRTARLAVPPERALARLDEQPVRSAPAAQRRRAVLEILIADRGPVEVSRLYSQTGSQAPDLRYLEGLGVITLSEAEVWRDPLAGMDFVPVVAPRLTPDQSKVMDSLRQAILAPPASTKQPFLLHGVTGSGKTEIYMQAVDLTLARDRTAIVLVPEIALTPQTIRRFLARFPGQVGLLHSQLSEGERFDTWRRCRLNEIQVLIGPRSALFAPLSNIGLIVLDEAHDESYKEQGMSPRYHAAPTAIAYAEMLGAVCMLGSATPDIVTAFQAEHGHLERLSLPQRILGHRERIGRQADRLGRRSRYRPDHEDALAIDLPPVRVVDMRQELKAGNRSLFSRALHQALGECLAAGEQAILFLNRRGTSTYVFCRDCGLVLDCPRCDTPLTYHTARERLQCHHCGYERRLPSMCPNCGGSRIRQFGAGTQKIQYEVETAFPSARTIRWDWDATRTKGAHEDILARFAAFEADVLIGTQMVAKGLDLPLVTLVGVISADTGLNLPDYRAAERTFQVLTQVVGRAGRGLLGGRVILQTYEPDHYAVRAAANHDYPAFYKQELEFRRRLGYPPFTRLARLVYRHTSSNTAEAQARRMGEAIRHRLEEEDLGAGLIGPVPCFYRRVRGEYRWQVIIRASDPRPLIPLELESGWIVDVDPVSLL